MKKLSCVLLSGCLFVMPAIGYSLTCTYASIPDDRELRSLVDNLDGTITDTKTGLMWKKCLEGQIWFPAANTCSSPPTTHDWNAALSKSNVIFPDVTGHSDWRVPNVKELASLLHSPCFDPSIDTAAFPHPDPLPSGFFLWSASPYNAVGSSAWGFDAVNGLILDFPKQNKGYVRLVRGG